MKLKKLLVSAALISSSLLHLSTTKASIEEIRIKVDNLRCRFCAQNLSDKLSALPQIKTVRMNRKGATLLLSLEKENDFDPSILKRVVETGTRFTLKDIKISATGTIVKEDNNLVLDIEGNSNKIHLSKLSIPKKKTYKKVSFKRKPTKAIANITNKALDKTASLFKNIPTTSKKVDTKLKSFSDKKNIIRLKGSIKLQNDGNLWLLGKNYAQFIDADTDDLKLALKY